MTIFLVLTAFAFLPQSNSHGSVLSPGHLLLLAVTTNSDLKLELKRELAPKMERVDFLQSVLLRLENLWNAHKGWEGHSGHTQGEQPRALVELVLSLPPGARALEIGFNCGHSAAAILSARSDITLVSLDLGEHSYVEEAKNIIDELFPRRHLLLLGDSTKTLPSLKGKFDLYFIDGCHLIDVVRKDVENVLARARPMDIFILDDVLLETAVLPHFSIGPTTVWKELVDKGCIIPRGQRDLGNMHGWAWGNKP